MKQHLAVKTIVFLFFVGAQLFLNLETMTAGDNYWTQVGLAGAGTEALAIDSNNHMIVYAGTSGVGIYKSVNGGMSWERIGQDIAYFDEVTDITIDPSDSNIVYVAPKWQPLQKSTNGGKDWFTLDMSSSNIVSVSPFDSNLLLSSGERIWRSVDAGKTWELVPGTPVNIRAIVFAPNDPNVVYAGAAESGIWRSVDSGETWKGVNNGFAVPPYVFSVAIDPEDGLIVYIGTSRDGMYKTNNGGDAWIPISDGLASNNIRSIAIDPTNRNTIYAGTGNNGGPAGVYQSFDMGRSWNPFMEGMGSKWIFELALDNTRNIYSATSSGVWKYTDVSGKIYLPVIVNRGNS